MPRPLTGAPTVRLLLPLVAIVGVTVAACDLAVDRTGSSGPPSPTATSNLPTSSTTSTTTAAITTAASRPLPATTATGPVDLAQQPCAALDQDQAVALGAQAAGERVDLDSGPACRWVTSTAIVAFLPSPDTDLTADPALQARTSPTQVSGHAARTGIQGTDAANCIVLVSLGAGQSFELMLIPTGSGPRGHDLCNGLGINVAAAVLTHLP